MRIELSFRAFILLSDVGPELSTTDEALLGVRPAIMDIKMGTLTYAPDASAAKIKSRKRKDGATTTESHGLRVCGGRVPTGALSAGAPRPSHLLHLTQRSS